MTRLNAGLTTLFRKKLASRWLALCFSLVSVFLVVQPIVINGVSDRLGNLLFYNQVVFSDGSIHLALIAELASRFPPTNFAASGVPLKNYHYLYDFFLALLGRVSLLDPYDLYFRVGPVLTAFLFLALLYQVVYRLTRDRLLAAFSLPLTVFSTSFGVLVPAIKKLFGGSYVIGGSNTFMTDQLLNMMTNPQGFFSLALFLGLYLALDGYERTRRTIFLVFLAIVTAVSFGTKAYAGLVFTPALIMTGSWFWLKHRDARPFFAGLIGAVSELVWVRMTIDNRVAGLRLAPFWLLDHMVADLDKLNEGGLLTAKESYAALESWWRVGVYYFLALVTYLVGSLGTRVPGAISYLACWRNLNKLPLGLIFILAASLVSLAVPLLANQSSKAYDVVQFTPYFTLTMSLMFSLFVARWLAKFSFPVKFLCLVVLVLVSALFSWREINIRFQPAREEIVFSDDLVAATEFIHLNTKKEAIFLLAPTEFNLGTAWFSALAKRRTVFSARAFAFQTGAPVENLEVTVTKIFQEGERLPTFDYVFLRQSELAAFGRIETNFAIREVFSNRSVRILKRI